MLSESSSIPSSQEKVNQNGNSNGNLGKIILDEPGLKARVAELGKEISNDYQDRDLMLLGVLKGAVFFLSDLVRSMSIPVTFDFISISRYQRGNSGSGEVQMIKDVNVGIQGRHLLLVEDIVDTGLTLNYLLRTLNSRRPASLEICTLLDRPYLRLLPLAIRYVGFTIPNDYVVGYGLDFQERYRQLPHLRYLTPPAVDK
jgi:hypoxanthine phosphoribosyltransferase